MKRIEHIYPNWGVTSKGELDFFYVLKYMNLYHGCAFKKASGFKGLTIGVVDNKNRGIVAPGKVQKILTLSEFIELTKEDEVSELLTEDNIKDYGFEPFRSSTKDWLNFMNHELKFGISICKVTEHGFIAGSWYFGSDTIKIDTVEELKKLYKLVTKKELTKICTKKPTQID